MYVKTSILCICGQKLNTQDSDDSFIDDSEYDTDASLSSGKAKADADGDENEVQCLASASEDEWRPRRRTRHAAAEKKYSLHLTVFSQMTMIVIGDGLVKWQHIGLCQLSYSNISPGRLTISACNWLPWLTEPSRSLFGIHIEYQQKLEHKKAHYTIYWSPISGLSAQAGVWLVATEMETS